MSAHSMDHQLRIKYKIDFERRMMDQAVKDEREARERKMRHVQRINDLEKELAGELCPGCAA